MFSFFYAYTCCSNWMTLHLLFWMWNKTAIIKSLSALTQSLISFHDRFRTTFQWNRENKNCKFDKLHTFISKNKKMSLCTFQIRLKITENASIFLFGVMQRNKDQIVVTQSLWFTYFLSNFVFSSTLIVFSVSFMTVPDFI